MTTFDDRSTASWTTGRGGHKGTSTSHYRIRSRTEPLIRASIIKSGDFPTHDRTHLKRHDPLPPPGPVTNFKHPSYIQFHTFLLGASLIVFDSFASGRKFRRSEFWRLQHQRRAGEWPTRRKGCDAARARERGAGERRGGNNSRWKYALHTRTLVDHLKPYSCYAPVILYGSAMRETLREAKCRAGWYRRGRQHA